MLRPSCNEALPETLYPDGCNAQAQVCGREDGHNGDHRAWVQMAPLIVDWPAESPHIGRDVDGDDA